MAQRHNDPFAELAQHIGAHVNPYLPMLRDNATTGSLAIRYGKDLKDSAGSWRQYFQDKHKLEAKQLIFEIGCHLGKTICEFAGNHPDYAFVGADITFKRVCKTALKAQQRDLNNIVSILFNGKFSSAIFAEGELDGAVIFFPDPWVKERRAKHRLLSPDLAAQLHRLLRPEGMVWFKTDQKPYFDDTVSFLEGAGLVRVAKEDAVISFPLAAKPYTTTFEHKFQLAGLPTYECFFQKKLS